MGKIKFCLDGKIISSNIWYMVELMIFKSWRGKIADNIFLVESG